MSNIVYPALVLALIVGPVRTEQSKDGSRTILTHLQKESRCGFMITWPFCIHVWYFWKKQEYDTYHPPIDDQQKHWLPGTEQGIYMRTPGWRWDTDLGMIWTWGYVGGHWD